MSSFASMKNAMNTTSGHKEYFDGKTAACLSCSQRYDLPNLIIHVNEEHTMVDLIEGFCEACFYIDDLEMKKALRYQHKK